jgi:hypothetical protein
MSDHLDPRRGPRMLARAIIIMAMVIIALVVVSQLIHPNSASGNPLLLIVLMLLR